MRRIKYRRWQTPKRQSTFRHNITRPATAGSTSHTEQVPVGGVTPPPMHTPTRRPRQLEVPVWWLSRLFQRPGEVVSATVTIWPCPTVMTSSPTTAFTSPPNSPPLSTTFWPSTKVSSSYHPETNGARYRTCHLRCRTIKLAAKSQRTPKRLAHRPSSHRVPLQQFNQPDRIWLQKECTPAVPLGIPSPCSTLQKKMVENQGLDRDQLAYSNSPFSVSAKLMKWFRGISVFPFPTSSTTAPSSSRISTTRQRSTSATGPRSTTAPPE